jgi:hypothetical protein
MGVRGQANANDFVVSDNITIIVPEGQTFTISSASFNMPLDRDPGNIHIYGGPQPNSITISGSIPLNLRPSDQNIFSQSLPINLRQDQAVSKPSGPAFDAATSMQGALRASSSLLMTNNAAGSNPRISIPAKVSKVINLEGIRQAESAIRDAEGRVQLSN